MPSKMTITGDKEFHRNLALFADALELTSEEMTEYLTARIARDMMFKTYPRGGTEKTQKILEGAIERDVKKVYCSLGTAYHIIEREQGTAQASTYLHHMKNGNTASADMILANIWTLKGGGFDGGSEYLSQRKKGKIPRGRNVIRKPIRNAQYGERKSYIVQRKKHAGKLKAGFYAIYASLGHNVGATKSWISRHGKTLGRVNKQGSTRADYIVTSENLVDYATDKLSTADHRRAMQASYANVRRRAIANLKKRTSKL